jgi:hypothetical protein
MTCANDSDVGGSFSHGRVLIRMVSLTGTTLLKGFSKLYSAGTALGQEIITGDSSRPESYGFSALLDKARVL